VFALVPDVDACALSPLGVEFERVVAGSDSPPDTCVCVCVCVCGLGVMGWDYILWPCHVLELLLLILLLLVLVRLVVLQM
jgi:hypothetical protein